MFLGSRYQRGYGLGSIFKGLFRWAVPCLKQGAKALGKKALKTGVNVVQDVLEGENVQAAVTKRGKQANDIVSHNTPRSQVGSGRKTTKRKKEPTTLSSASVKKRKTAPQKKKKQSGLHHYFYK